MPDAPGTHDNAHAAQAAPGSPCQCDQQLGHALPLILIVMALVVALDRWSSWRKKRRARSDNPIEPNTTEEKNMSKIESEAGALSPGCSVDLTEAVAYQEGAIVSRTLMKQNGGSVTLFAFDRSQALSEHTAPFDALVQVLDGEVELVIGGESVAARAGQSVLMPADVPHAVNATGRFKMLLTMIRDVPSAK